VLLDKLEDTRGGVGANIAGNLALLGEKPLLMGAVGQSAAAYVADLKALGIDVANVHVSHLPTASFNVITDSEDNQVGGFYPGAMLDSDALSFAPWQGQNALMMVSAHAPKGMNRQVQECRDLGLRLVYDPGQQVSDEQTDLKTGLDVAEILFVNDYELGVLTKKTGLSADEIKSKVPLVITTLGKEGSVIAGAKVQSPIQIPIAQPDKVVDPTGAGDAYRAGFLYGYLRQWELAKCGRLASVVASFIVEEHGTQRQFSKDMVRQRYQSSFNEEIEL
jgi:adenosine kinase